MTFFKSGSKQRDQRGFTILELVVSLAIFAIISGAVTYAVIQMLSVNASSTNRITAIRQVQNAGYWVSRDAQQAQIVLKDDPYTTEVDGFLVLFSWTEWSGVKNVVIYNYNEADGELVRSHYQDGAHYQDGVLVDVTTVARFISDANIEIPDELSPEKVINLTVEATVGGFQRTSETRVYEIIPRPGLGG